MYNRNTHSFIAAYIHNFIYIYFKMQIWLFHIVAIQTQIF